MQRTVLWGIIAVLALPAFATAEGPPAIPPADGKNAAPQTPAGTAPVNVLVVEDLATTETLDAVRGTEPQSTTYWLGLSCQPTDDTLGAQLGLSGLVIRQVADDSPASTAGLHVHDIITQVTFGETTAKPADIAQLSTLVQQAQMKPMTFLLLRAGKPLNVAVTPAERKTAENSFKSGLSNSDSN
ncbi:MAG: PDZ domain-containing protein, partial [Planctomycetaceae bacterium]